MIFGCKDVMKNNDVAHPQYIFNRHHSWMQFNQRVLEEARDAKNPLLERVKFLAITASNLDEFVEVRVAGILQQVEHGNCEPGPDGRVPAEVLKELAEKIHSFVKAQYDCWREELLPALAAESVRVVSWKKLGPAARLYIENYYVKSVEPLLTPVTVDPAHPFPHVLNKALCLAFLLKRKRRGGQTYLGVVTVPRALPRLVLLPAKDGTVEYVFLSDVIQAFANRLYHGYEVLSAAAFRVTRNSNLYLEEEESRSILDTVDAQLHRRRKGEAVRLEIEASANQEIIDRLVAHFVFVRPGATAGFEVPAVCAARAGAEVRRDFAVRFDSQTRFAAASSIRFVFGSGAVDRERGERSGRAFDQADAVSHEREFADRAGAY